MPTKQKGGVFYFGLTISVSLVIKYVKLEEIIC